VTVNWTLSDGNSADFYLINITTNTLHTPYGGLLNITNASITQHELTGFMADSEYNITVHGTNCVNQEGKESEPVIIRPQGRHPANIVHKWCLTSSFLVSTMLSVITHCVVAICYAMTWAYR